ncbi:MAG TPA: D-aminoacyl-tRNA deacylase [Saprospiraceae bacterium]|nr:D-aminoacyl-tRNA deacylase [Saprospiraceae bacterium]
MRAVVQRVESASVEVNNQIVASIDSGYLVLLGIEHEDDFHDIEWLTHKINTLRIFPDVNGKMNLSIFEAKGELLIVSQFTLYASTRKGNRPSFIKSASPEIAENLYEKFCLKMINSGHKKIGKGIFGAYMKVSLINDGPVTILLDSKNKE